MDPAEDTIDGLMRMAAAAPAVSLPGRFTGTERYELKRALGEGGFGIVYEAIDHRQGGRVALKVLRRTHADGLYRFKREFRALSELGHPNLVRLYELISVENDWFFTMELVDGVPITEFLARTPGRLRATLEQLALGLGALHRAGKLHRDVKPSNVLVTPEGRTVLLDFGLAIDLTMSETSEMAGTPLYMSPEQCAAEPLTEASDWYAVGVMLYEVLTGAPPFSGTPLQLFAAKREREAPRPVARAGVPADLVELCRALLAREPAARPTGTDVLRLLKSGSAPTPLPARAAASFVGRAAQLTALRANFERSRHGRRTVTFLRGPSGIGKSALLRHFLDEVSREHPDAVVLAGRCYEREWVPYKALDPIVDEVARYLRHMPDGEVAVVAPRDRAALTQLFPVLRQIPSFAKARGAQVMEPAEQKSRGMAALREMMARLADTRPVLICVDDLHWGDVDSAALLAELARPPDPPAICFIGTFRSEEAATSPLLRRLTELRRTLLNDVEISDLVLAQLDPEDSLALAAQLLGAEGADAARAAEVARESGGVPFFVHELARLGNDDGGGVDELVRRRVERLPDEARRLLEVVATFGRPLDADLAAAMTERAESLRDAMTELRLQRLVRTRQEDSRSFVESYHDRIREGVVNGLDAERRRALHACIAEALERAGGSDTDAEMLASHWREAGETGRAAHHAAIAAAHAAGTLAFDRAARLYRLALEGRPAAVDDEETRRLRALCGEALANAGRGAEAAGEFRAAAMGAPVVEAFEYQRRAADELLRSGHIDEGLQVLGEVLRHGKLRLAATPARAAASFLRYSAWTALRGLSFRPREAHEVPPEELLRIDVAFVASLTLGFVDPLGAADMKARFLLWSLRAGEPTRITLALVTMGGFSAFAGVKGERKAHRYLELAEKLAQSRNDTRGLASVMGMRGLVAYLTGRWRHAHTRLTEASELMRQNCTGMAWEIDASQVFIAETLGFLGDVGELSRHVAPRLRDAEERGDLYCAVSLRTGAWHLSWLARDEPETARRESDEGARRWSVNSFHVQHLYHLIAHAHVDLYTGDFTAAWRKLDEKEPLLQKSLMLRGQTLRVRMWDLRGRVALAHARAGIDREAMLRAAERAARNIEREPAAWAHPLGVLLRAQLAALAGRDQEAAVLCAEAESGFARADMALHADMARWAGARLGGDGSLADSARAQLEDRLVRRPERLAAVYLPGIF